MTTLILSYPIYVISWCLKFYLFPSPLACLQMNDLLVIFTCYLYHVHHVLQLLHKLMSPAQYNPPISWCSSSAHQTLKNRFNKFGEREPYILLFEYVLCYCYLLHYTTFVSYYLLITRNTHYPLLESNGHNQHRRQTLSLHWNKCQKTAKLNKHHG